MLSRSVLIAIIVLSLQNSLAADYYEKGCQNFIRKKYDIAREMFLKEIELNGSGDAYYFLGEIEKNEGNMEKAEEYYRESLLKNIDKFIYYDLNVMSKKRLATTGCIDEKP